VDSETEEFVTAATERSVAGRTAIIIAHRLATVREASRILVVHKGEIREEGRHDELMARQGLYADLYRLQFASSAEASLSFLLTRSGM
jgi:ATP-binding cassette subfamily B protein